MGCQVCKEIIDNRDALAGALGCMGTSILLAAPDGVSPTRAMAEDFRAKAEALAATAAQIESYVRNGGAGSEGGAASAPPSSLPGRGNL